jgi:septum site-determining protein MinC
VRYSGAVLVLGDVNPGAEIVAGGDVIVWGKLRGVVHAGAMGDEHAVVCALELAPTQLRIAGRIAIAPDDRRRRRQITPEIARIRDGHIVAEGWKA